MNPVPTCCHTVIKELTREPLEVLKTNLPFRVALMPALNQVTHGFV